MPLRVASHSSTSCWEEAQRSTRSCLALLTIRQRADVCVFSVVLSLQLRVSLSGVKLKSDVCGGERVRTTAGLVLSLVLIKYYKKKIREV